VKLGLDEGGWRRDDGGEREGEDEGGVGEC